MRNPHTGYYEYVTLQQQILVCTGVIAGRADPSSLGIPKYALASPQKRESIRSQALAKQTSTTAGPTSGTFQNLVVFVRFSDQSEFSDPISTYSELYNGTSASSISLLKYYQEVSYNQLTINSVFFPAPSHGTVVSYRDSHTQAYYMPYDATANPTGYLDGNRTGREDSLLLGVVNGVKNLVPDSLAVTNQIPYIDRDGHPKVLGRTLLASAARLTDPYPQLLERRLLEYFRANLSTAHRLVSIGYSFGDSDINEIVQDWLAGATTRRLQIVVPGAARAPGFLQELAAQVELTPGSATTYLERVR